MVDYGMILLVTLKAIADVQGKCLTYSIFLLIGKSTTLAGGNEKNLKVVTNV